MSLESIDKAFYNLAIKERDSERLINEKLRSDLAAARAECDNLKHDIDRCVARNSDLLAECERLREDAEQLKKELSKCQQSQ